MSARLDEVAATVGGVLSGAEASAGLTVAGVSCDSRQVDTGDLFCCVVGATSDGHTFAPDAVAAGAAALLVDRVLDTTVPTIRVPDVRAAMAPAAALVYGRPADRLPVIGVTGTNGKTSVVTMLAHVLGEVGRPTGVIGTLTGARTTPESPELQRRLRGFVEGGLAAAAIEVSSHALVLHRVDAVDFEVAVFTNLGIDHLDFHHTQEAYFAAKARLFEPGRARYRLVNLDDTHGRLLLDTCRDDGGGPVIGYSLADLGEVTMGPQGSQLRWRGIPVRLPLVGRFNLSNALAVAEVAVLLGAAPVAVAAALASLPVVPGRFEAVVAGQPFPVLVDYAHTPDALETVLGAAREVTGPGGRVILVVGAGGDRDRGKRPLMGAAAAAGADLTFLTSDNPRSEDPFSILEAVTTGFDDALRNDHRIDRNVRREVVPDRREAIGVALGAAGAGDVVVIAGKGHETTQVLADRTEPFDDRVEARAALARIGYTAEASS